MGWFWSASSSKDENGSIIQKQNDEAVKSLDPTLQEYLKSSTPDIPTPPPKEADRKKEKEKDGIKTILSRAADKYSPPPPEDYQPPPAHAQSAYGDKYADLWATYKPFNGGGFIAHTEQQKTRDFVEAIYGRKKEITNAAVENCSLEHLDLWDCFKNGTYTEKLWSCHKQSRKFNDCVEKQISFLKALGYLAIANRDPAVEEAIQIRADSLYRRELAENEAAEAKPAADKPADAQ